LSQQLRQLEAQAQHQVNIAALAQGLEAFCRKVQPTLDQLTFAHRRPWVALLIDRVIVTADQVEIRYVGPTGPQGETTPFCHVRLDYLKAERGWHNLNLTREGIHSLLMDQSWYQLQIPAEEMAFDAFEKIRLWEEIALSLLKKYTERYYTFRKREWELPHLEYRDLEAGDPNFLGVKEAPEDGYYRIQIEKSQEGIIGKLKELKTLIEKGDLKPWEFRGMKAIWFGRHLYQPLLYLEQKIVEISPAPLNKGERQFVEDLKAFYDNAGDFFADKELYLLRNLSKGRGVGFFEAGNFHPDFIL
jgi:hypothetical protein